MVSGVEEEMVKRLLIETIKKLAARIKKQKLKHSYPAKANFITKKNKA